MKCPLLLDANAMISLFEGSDPELERALCSAEELVVPVVAYAEVVAGTEMDTKRAKMTREALLMLLATPNTRLFLQGRWRPCHIPELGIVAGREKMI